MTTTCFVPLFCLAASLIGWFLAIDDGGKWKRNPATPFVAFPLPPPLLFRRSAISSVLLVYFLSLFFLTCRQPASASSASFLLHPPSAFGRRLSLGKGPLQRVGVCLLYSVRFGFIVLVVLDRVEFLHIPDNGGWRPNVRKQTQHR